MAGVTSASSGLDSHQAYLWTRASSSLRALRHQGGIYFDAWPP